MKLPTRSYGEAKDDWVIGRVEHLGVVKGKVRCLDFGCTRTEVRKEGENQDGDDRNHQVGVTKRPSEKQGNTETSPGSIVKLNPASSLRYTYHIISESITALPYTA